MIETNVSGNLYATKDSHTREGESYTIRSKNGQGWGLPVRDLEPSDLRALADRIELAREK